MEKYLSKDQVKAIIEGAPKGYTPGKVVDGLVARGYVLEGFNEPKPTVMDTVKDYATEAVTNPLETAKGIIKGIPGNAAQLTKLVEMPGKFITGKIAEATGTQAPQGLDYSAVEELTAPSNKAQQVGYVASGLLPVERAIGGVELAAKGVSGGLGLAKTGVSKAGEVISPMTEGVTTLTKDVINPLVKAPSRLKANLAEKQLQQAEIQALPTKQARNVVNEGVDIADTKDIINLTKESKTPELRKLFSTVEDFASGNKKVDPAEIVGTPIVKKLKESEKLKNVIGKQLTDVSKNLGVVTKSELTNAVISRLRQVPGMENVALKGNILDFKNTTLASQLTKSDRATIQKAFEQSTKWGNGEKAHKFRQELFEILGGKKKSLETMTATQEESLNAIRKGLADVLDTKNPQYKALNETYARLAQPVSEMRKLMKGLAPDDPEDILNMSAGLLARRLTSAAPSNANVRMILKSLDEVVPSDTLGRVESLQDFYNILNKYYDIAPRTGFQNLTKEAIDSSMVSKVTGKVGEYIGKTDATRQKALKEFLESVLKD